MRSGLVLGWPLVECSRASMSLIVSGDRRRFAIESQITEVKEKLNFLGLGFFVLHINGVQYGVREPDATMLACSYDEVERRIARRGSHVAPNLASAKSDVLARAVFLSIYGEPPDESPLIGDLSSTRIEREVYDNKILWAPDGDEAFDDSSKVLQFDIADRVRLVGFKTDEDLPRLVTDVSMESDAFYAILDDWLTKFNSSRHALLQQQRGH